jgi:competence protein ComEA
VLKYAVAGLAVVAAIAALLWRPPHVDFGAPQPAASFPSAAPGAFVAGDAPIEPAPRLSTRRAVPQTVVVYVAGEVLRPGVYALPAKARADAALARAGGAKPDADLVAVNLAEPLADGMEIAVPKTGEARGSERRTAVPHRRRAYVPRGLGRHRRDAQAAAAADPSLTSIDLNTAGAAELEALPGIGPALAERIVAYRDENGPFASIDELADIAGITPGLQEAITPYLVVR